MRRQFRTMGATFDWDAEVVTCDPEYYRWNQWLFLRFLEAGLAYRAMSPVDWCPNDGTLAREQVEGADRHCWRCGAGREARPGAVVPADHEVRRRAARLHGHRLARADPDPADELDRPVRGRRDRLHDGARRPPGRRRRAARVHDPAGHALRRDVHGPRAGAPARREADRTRTGARRSTAYVAQAGRETEIERLSTDREKTGVAIGADAINPVNGERIPIWVADYVLAGYGTGAIMAVPAHDERDFAFARKFGLPIRRVVGAGGHVDDEASTDRDAYVAHTADERLVNSGRFTGMSAPDGVRAIVDWLAGQGKGKAAVTYRLRDWLISRQRYWGTPIPVIYCERDGIVPVPDEDLPVCLPETVDYARQRREPAATATRRSCDVACPRCGGPARRETDTMDTFMDSWYWFRYLSPHKEDGPIDRALDGRAGRRSTSTPAAPSTPSCTCCTAASSPRRCATSASSTTTSRSGGCSTRARSWAPTASG